MLKKQTVWLLTMLSLMIVLSVYYMTSPSSGDLAYIDNGQADSDEAVTKDQADSSEDVDVDIDNISKLGENELFTTLRMDLQDQRSLMKDRLDDIVASSSATTEEKNQARNDMNSLDEVATKESILEESIIAAAGYNDVLVRSDDDKVHVHVQVENLSKQETVNIMQMVKDEFGEVTVVVNFQPTKS